MEPDLKERIEQWRHTELYCRRQGFFDSADRCNERADQLKKYGDYILFHGHNEAGYLNTPI